jgi:hypothetical protein
VEAHTAWIEVQYRTGLDNAYKETDRMKKYLNALTAVLFTAVFLACGSAPAPAAPAPAAGISLEAAAREAAVRMDARLPAKTEIALVSVGSSSAQLSEYIINQLEASVVDSGKLVVVDRANLDKIRKEQGLQTSGEVSDESAKAIGKLLGAGAIVTGSFTDLGEVYHLVLKAINMETGAVAVSYPADIAKSSRITAMLASGGGAGAGVYGGSAAPSAQGASANPAPAPVPAPVPAVPAQTAAPAPAAEKVYQIGETGPAGGLIFYDKGYSSDGWQYLEAAVRDAPTAHWGPKVGGTREGIGTGKQNTELIVRADETGTAARRCREYKQGEYGDWFLPSRDELDLMFKNLQQKGLGGFSNAEYWSSSGESSGHGAWNQYFKDGTQNNGAYRSNYRDNTLAVRAIRQF